MALAFGGGLDLARLACRIGSIMGDEACDDAANNVVHFRCDFIGCWHSRRWLEVKEIKVSNVSTSVRIIAGIVGLVFIGLGFWQPERLLPGTVLPTAEITGQPATARMSEREHDKDRYGGDYLGFDVNTDHIEDCEAACKADTKCAAWTYIKRGLHGPRARCYLKSVIPAISDNVCCVSGTKIR